MRFTWIRRNHRWVFSGVGVLVLTLIISPSLSWLRTEKPEVTGAAPSANGNDSAQGEPLSLRRHIHRQRVAVGDYIDITVEPWVVRVMVQRVATEQVGASGGPVLGAKEEPIAQLHVDLGGALIHGGAHCVNVATNTFVVPQVGVAHDEDVASLVAFRNTRDHSWFVRVAAEHINVAAQTADISIVLIQ